MYFTNLVNFIVDYCFVNKPSLCLISLNPHGPLMLETGVEGAGLQQSTCNVVFNVALRH